MDRKIDHKLQVFLEEPGFMKLFALFKEKYRSLGRVGGSVSLKGFADDELEAIAGFYGISKAKLSQKGTVSLQAFEKELAKTSFSEYTLLDIMEKVLGEKIISKKEERRLEHEREEAFIQSLLEEIPGAHWWLQRLAEKSPDTRWIWSLYKQNDEDLYEKIIMAYRAFTYLPKQGEFERLPFFSERVSGNPHYFDSQRTAGKLLHHMLFVDQLRKGNNRMTMPKTVEELNDLLAEYGIFRDDLWNFVTCQQLLASTEEVHPVWKAACESRTVMNVPMKELMKVDKIWPIHGNTVWVVENSGVASMMMDALPKVPIVCTHGQVRMAGWRLLDLIVQSGATIFYSGDMDPEGLLIADRMKTRYKDKVILWKMEKQTYLNYLSEEDIADRLSKLDSIRNSELFELRDVLKEQKKACYQESFVNELKKSIENYTHK
ncbi:TIGR02679 family protein [Fervidibacillus halotolerans]|uniref:TIGR02679 family protein n=1 Tax=Fervidibacillus halotolerans TaxID=2980027 RepID=A0A9E8M0J9_9BACI|nr:TIGR02679 family protein [Fervidibacillus halotolerans]WAA12099.1 TIGR02679 family protein [Fervidibacillus halotolerans]